MGSVGISGVLRVLLSRWLIGFIDGAKLGAVTYFGREMVFVCQFDSALSHRGFSLHPCGILQ